MNKGTEKRRVKWWVAVLVLASMIGVPTYWMVAREDDTGEALIDAARRGNLTQARHLIESGTDLDAVDRIYGSTPIMWAAHEGHVEVLALLLKEGGNPNTMNPLGRTALWFAAQQGQEQTARLLIVHGVKDTNPMSDAGVVASQVAQQNGHHNLAKLLREARNQ